MSFALVAVTPHSDLRFLQNSTCPTGALVLPAVTMKASVPAAASSISETLTVRAAATNVANINSPNLMSNHPRLME
nr:hypothetical protein [Breoghania sp.]